MARGRRGRGRGATRGRKAVRVLSSDEEQQEKEASPEPNKNTDVEKMEETIGAGQSEKMEIDVSTSEKCDENTKKSDESVNEKKISDESTTNADVSEVNKVPTIDMEADISQLEAPTFTTISRGPPEPMLHLDWNHKVNLIGEKVINPMIHCCDQCDKPILIYGRMIPCKHVFCLSCARKETMKMCPRCKEKAIRVEQTGLGTVFMCTHGGTRYESKGCRRTYLSQRDLQAHINHRHINTPMVPRLESLAVKLNDSNETGTQNTSNVLLSPQKKTETRVNPSSHRTGSNVGSSPNTSNQYFNAPSSQNRASQGQQYFSSFSGGYSGSNQSSSGASDTQWNQGQYYR